MSTLEQRRDSMTFEQISKLLRYDSGNGRLFWLPRTPDQFAGTEGRTAEHACANWNSKFSGKEAFTATNGHGYRRGTIFNRRYQAHRIVWLLHYGKWPAADIDHINGDRADNRLINLRSVSRAENAKNQRARITNTSGVLGVSWDKQTGKWRVSIQIEGQTRKIGRFPDIESAAAARKAADLRFGFHPNHGRS